MLKDAQEKFEAGLQHLHAEKLELAERCFRAAVTARPTFVQAHYNLGFVLQRRGRHRQALRAFETAIDLDPNYAQGHIALAFVFDKLGDYASMEAHLRKAIAAKPQFAEGHRRLGDLMKVLGRWDQAHMEYERALTLEPANPEARFGRGFVSLMRGDLPIGWRDYEFRKSTVLGNDPALTPRWRGEDPHAKTLLIYSDQGFGDAIQFMRYVPALAARGARILLAVPMPLMGLAARLEGVAEIVTPNLRFPRFDWSCPLGSLPLHFETTIQTIPSEVPYLSVPPERIELWRQQLDLGERRPLTVALSWSGNPNHPNDRYRSMQFSDLEVLLNQKHVRYIVLQTDAAVATRHRRENLLVLGPDLKDFMDIAAVISVADLVISVDTVFCHLAGALGRPAWTLLSCVSDWRWFQDRDDTPWYPTMKLYRQPKLGDWATVVNAALSDLNRLVERSIPAG